ncbi:helix-turn-helix domain-containing protein [Microbacterium sp. p3-SID338]|uniref:helix-turn-helix domain-containing protein n=1 Tax=Microbacterium sp. p3-SID338 TaxID=2916214 RepID=UPI0021A7AC66|nr:helix-turn-helix domain-containing protein [Microbacterium sp. p3-SID338]MCT1395655.1 helix-turn-helix domain-containing protein [Microbacterium sp. p3-SID338]
MPEPKEWMTVKEAAALIGRHVSQVYRWIDAGRLTTRVRADGVTVVLSKAVLRIEPSVRRGRPRGSISQR